MVDRKIARIPIRILRALDYATRNGAKILSFSAHWADNSPELQDAFARVADADAAQPEARPAIVVASVPNKGEALAGFPAAYSFRRIVRAIPIGNDDIISPGTSAAPPGLNFGAPLRVCSGGHSREYGISARAWKLEFDRNPIGTSGRSLVERTLC